MAITWAIVGCGDVATKKVVPSFKHTEGVKIIGVTAKHRERAEAFATRFGLKKVYDTVEDLLSDPEIDAVYIATPPNLHHPITVAAAQARKHVLCEKPMALNTSQCLEMVAACRRNNVKLMVAYYRRFWPQTKIMKSLIDQEELGEVVNARTQMTGNVGFEPERVRKWKLDPTLSGGGFLMDVGCHRIDLLLHLLGDVVDVTAFTDSVKWEYAVDNSSNVLMRFKSGALAVGAFNWNVEFFSDEFEIIGTRAKLIASPLGADRIYLQRRGETTEIATPRAVHTHSALIAHCTELIEGKITQSALGDVGVQVSRVIEAAYRSSNERRTISIVEVS